MKGPGKVRGESLTLASWENCLAGSDGAKCGGIFFRPSKRDATRQVRWLLHLQAMLGEVGK
jgi:hypothetical protein